MKKTFLLLVSLTVLSSSLLANERIKLEANGVSYSDSQNQIPIDVRLSGTMLELMFFEETVYRVIVTGEEGIVFQRQFEARTFETVSIELSQYRSGDYTIRIYDMDGNEVTGDFAL